MLNRAILVQWLLAAASIGAQTPAAIRQAAGCYSLTVSEWSPSVGADSAYHRIPTVVHLDTLPARFGGWVLSPDIAYPYHRGFPGAPRWTLSADTLRLVWSDGFSPTAVILVRRDSAWTGEAVAESDAHPHPEPPRPRARVVAQRRSCSSLPASGR